MNAALPALTGTIHAVMWLVVVVSSTETCKIIIG